MLTFNPKSYACFINSVFFSASPILYAVHAKGDKFQLSPKKIGTILVYGDNDVETSGVNNAIGTMKDIISYMKSEDMGIVHGTAYKIGDAKKNTELMKQAYDLGLEVSK